MARAMKMKRVKTMTDDCFMDSRTSAEVFKVRNLKSPDAIPSLAHVKCLCGSLPSTCSKFFSNLLSPSSHSHVLLFRAPASCLHLPPLLSCRHYVYLSLFKIVYLLTN